MRALDIDAFEVRSAYCEASCRMLCGGFQKQRSRNASRGRSMPNPAEIIRETIHSAFVKYPQDDDPDWSHHWITVQDSDHLTKAVLLGLKAKGFEIVRNYPNEDGYL
jgi:hypothetical protein